MFELEAIRQRILTDDDFVLAEVDKIQDIYKLKAEIRYGRSREEEMASESVAEHVFGMQVCAQYFLPLEDPLGEWDKAKIMEMILWHDIEEIETGDIIGYLKTDADRKKEFEAQMKIIANLPKHLQDSTKALLVEYEKRITPEARFVKAIDKIETHVQCFNENGKQVLTDKETTLEQHKSIKDKYMIDFPYLKRFSEVITSEMIEQGFFIL